MALLMQLKFVEATSKNVFMLQAVNLLSLPIKYTDLFYHRIAYEYRDTSFLCTFHDIVVAGFSTRVEHNEGRTELYILTIAVLPVFRLGGIGRRMITRIEELARQKGCDSVYLHMHIRNQDGLRFYEKVGFTKERTLENYYTDLEDPHSYILRKSVVTGPKDGAQDGARDGAKAESKDGAQDGPKDGAKGEQTGVESASESRGGESGANRQAE